MISLPRVSSDFYSFPHLRCPLCLRLSDGVLMIRVDVDFAPRPGMYLSSEPIVHLVGCTDDGVTDFGAKGRAIKVSANMYQTRFKSGTGKSIL